MALCVSMIVHTQKLFLIIFLIKHEKNNSLPYRQIKLVNHFEIKCLVVCTFFLFMQCMSMRNKFDKKRYFFHEACWPLTFIYKFAFMPIYKYTCLKCYSPEILIANPKI